MLFLSYTWRGCSGVAPLQKKVRENRKRSSHDGAIPDITWCCQASGSSASVVRSFHLTLASDLPTRTTRLGVVSYSLGVLLLSWTNYWTNSRFIITLLSWGCWGTRQHLLYAPRGSLCFDRSFVNLSWIFPGALLTFNGAPGNIEGNLTGMRPCFWGRLVLAR